MGQLGHLPLIRVWSPQSGQLVLLLISAGRAPQIFCHLDQRFGLQVDDAENYGRDRLRDEHVVHVDFGSLPSQLDDRRNKQFVDQSIVHFRNFRACVVGDDNSRWFGFLLCCVATHLDLQTGNGLAAIQRGIYDCLD